MRFLELLERTTAYDTMFQAVPTQTSPEWVATKIQDIMSQARTALKRNDRVVWFLRLWRIGLSAMLQQGKRPMNYAATDASISQVQQLHDAYVRQYATASKLSADDIVAWSDWLYRQPGQQLRQLEHYFSLPIEMIQNYVMRYELPGPLLKRFQQAEKEWQDSRQGMIPKAEAEEGAQVILSFPNGFQWWHLDRAYCPLEAKAMGHCGNEPRANSGDRILSLRKPSKAGKQAFYMPYCTFILEEGGKLGEMKGRFNLSPKHAFEKGYSPSNFNDEILALLKLPMIEEVVGGGYMPEENFKITDLTPEQIDDLGKVKPQLMPLSVQYKRHGLTESLIKAIVARVTPYQKITWDKEAKGFVWETYKNMQNFIEHEVETPRDRTQPVAQWVNSVIDGGDSLHDQDYHVDNNAKEDLLHQLERKKPDIYARLHTHFLQQWQADNPEEDEDYAPDLLDLIEDYDDLGLDSTLYSAVSDGYARGAENEMYSHYKNWIDALKRPGRWWIVAEYWDSDVKVMVDAPTLIQQYENGDIENWAEYGSENKLWEIDDMSEPSYGYSGYDDDAALERLLEELPSEITEPKETAEAA